MKNAKISLSFIEFHMIDYPYALAVGLLKKETANYANKFVCIRAIRGFTMM